MTQAPTDRFLTIRDPADEQDLDCSSIQSEDPDRLEELTARYDDVLAQIDALDLRIQALLNEISGERPSNPAT
jgi:hypothetical protein